MCIELGVQAVLETIGEAISLVCIDEHKLLKEIERLLRRSIETVVIPGYEPDPTIKAEPIINGRPWGGDAAAAAAEIEGSLKNLIHLQAQ